jgi:hypothetical protein
MRMTNYRHAMILNSGIWLMPLLQRTQHLERLNTDSFVHDVVVQFFEVLNSIISEGKFNLVEERLDSEGLLCAIIMADMEGSTDIPREFTDEEADIINEVVIRLTDELLSVMDVECLRTGTQLQYYRHVTGDVYMAFESYWPFRDAPANQRADITRGRHREDPDHEFNRHWV